MEMIEEKVSKFVDKPMEIIQPKEKKYLKKMNRS